MDDPTYQPGPFDPAADGGYGPGGYGPGYSSSGRLHDPTATQGDRTFAMFEHLSFFLWFASVPVVVTLILWLVKKNESPFIDDHGRESLNMQISLVIYSIASVFLGFLTCGIAWALSGVILIGAIVFAILGATAANRGEYYRYPAVIRFL